MTMFGHLRRRTDRVDPDDPFVPLARNVVSEALDRRWRQMVGTVAVTALLAALAVSLPLTLLENAATDRAARDRSQHNCQLITRIAKIMGSGDPTDPALRAGGFLSSNAALTATETKNTSTIDGTGPLANLLKDPLTQRLERENETAEHRTLRHWKSDLIPALLATAHADCAT